MLLHNNNSKILRNVQVVVSTTMIRCVRKVHAKRHEGVTPNAVYLLFLCLEAIFISRRFPVQVRGLFVPASIQVSGAGGCKMRTGIGNVMKRSFSLTILPLLMIGQQVFLYVFVVWLFISHYYYYYYYYTYYYYY